MKPGTVVVYDSWDDDVLVRREDGTWSSSIYGDATNTRGIPMNDDEVENGIDCGYARFREETA